MSLQTLERKTFAAGSLIIKQGETAEAIYVVDKGQVEIWIESHGTRFALAQVATGGIFGEMALIDAHPRSANVSALVDTTVIVVPDKMFREKLDKADPLVKSILRVLVRNVRAENLRIAPLD